MLLSLEDDIVCRHPVTLLMTMTAGPFLKVVPTALAFGVACRVLPVVTVLHVVLLTRVVTLFYSAQAWRFLALMLVAGLSVLLMSVVIRTGLLGKSVGLTKLVTPAGCVLLVRRQMVARLRAPLLLNEAAGWRILPLLVMFPVFAM